MTPLAEHGASIRMRSNGLPSHHVDGKYLRGQPQACQVLFDPRHAVHVVLDGDQGDVRPLQYMAGLATGGRAGVEHALAVGKVQHIGGDLRRTILNCEQAFVETGQAGNVGAVRKHDGVGKPGVGVGLVGVANQRLDHRLAPGAPAVHPEHQRGFEIGDVEHRRGLVGPIGLDGLDQPGRMRTARGRVCIQARQQSHAFALPTP